MLAGGDLIVDVGVLSCTGINYSLDDCETKDICFITAQCPDCSCCFFVTLLIVSSSFSRSVFWQREPACSLHQTAWSNDCFDWICVFYPLRVLWTKHQFACILLLIWIKDLFPKLGLNLTSEMNEFTTRVVFRMLQYFINISHHCEACSDSLEVRYIHQINVPP